MTKQEILDKYIPCQCWPAKDGGKPVYNSSCPQHSPDPESAMDEWAQIQSISFAEWASNNNYSHRGDIWIHLGIHKFEFPARCSSKDLYELYKKETQQTKTT